MASTKRLSDKKPLRRLKLDRTIAILKSRSDPALLTKTALRYRRICHLNHVFSKADIQEVFNHMRASDLLDVNESLIVFHCYEPRLNKKSSQPQLRSSEIVGRRQWKKLEDLLGDVRNVHMSEETCRDLILLGPKGFNEVLRSIKARMQQKQERAGIKDMTQRTEVEKERNAPANSSRFNEQQLTFETGHGHKDYSKQQRRRASTSTRDPSVEAPVSRDKIRSTTNGRKRRKLNHLDEESALSAKEAASESSFQYESTLKACPEGQFSKAGGHPKLELADLQTRSATDDRSRTEEYSSDGSSEISEEHGSSCSEYTYCSECSGSECCCSESTSCSECSGSECCCSERSSSESEHPETAAVGCHSEQDLKRETPPQMDTISKPSKTEALATLSSTGTSKDESVSPHVGSEAQRSRISGLKASGTNDALNLAAIPLVHSGGCGSRNRFTNHLRRDFAKDLTIEANQGLDKVRQESDPPANQGNSTNDIKTGGPSTSTSPAVKDEICRSEVSAGTPSTELTPNISSVKLQPKRRTTGMKSSFFKTIRLPASPNIVRTKEVPLEYDSSHSPAKQSKNQKPPAGVSCIPMPPLTNKSFGLIQEIIWNQPLHLLVATTLLNKTTGQAAVPRLFQLLDRFGTAEALANAEVSDVLDIIGSLGLQWVRAARVIDLAKTWLKSPPSASKRYRVLHYPKHGDGANIQPDEIIGPEEEDPRKGAWEVAHLPGVGPYAIDSWRIFCRDKLRSLADDYNGTNAKPVKLGMIQRKDGAYAEVREGELKVPFEPEWKRVLPKDKELRAFLRWMWLREGWNWDAETGNRQKASQELIDKVNRGAEEVEVTGKAGLVGSVSSVPTDNGTTAIENGRKKRMSMRRPPFKSTDKQQIVAEEQPSELPGVADKGAEVMVSSSGPRSKGIVLPLPPNRGDKEILSERWRAEKVNKAPNYSEEIFNQQRRHSNNPTDGFQPQQNESLDDREGRQPQEHQQEANEDPSNKVAIEDSQPQHLAQQSTNASNIIDLEAAPPEAYSTAPSSRRSRNLPTPHFRPINEKISSSLSEPRNETPAPQPPLRSESCRSKSADNPTFSVKRRFILSSTKTPTPGPNTLSRQNSSPNSVTTSHEIQRGLAAARALSQQGAAIANLRALELSASESDDDVEPGENEQQSSIPKAKSRTSDQTTRPSATSPETTDRRGHSSSHEPAHTPARGRSLPRNSVSRNPRGRSVPRPIPVHNQKKAQTHTRSKSLAPSTATRNPLPLSTRRVAPLDPSSLRKDQPGKLRPTGKTLERKRAAEAVAPVLARVNGKKDSGYTSDMSTTADWKVLERVKGEMGGLRGEGRD